MDQEPITTDPTDWAKFVSKRPIVQFDKIPGPSLKRPLELK